MEKKKNKLIQIFHIERFSKHVGKVYSNIMAHYCCVKLNFYFSSSYSSCSLFKWKESFFFLCLRFFFFLVACRILLFGVAKQVCHTHSVRHEHINSRKQKGSEWQIVWIICCGGMGKCLFLFFELQTYWAYGVCENWGKQGRKIMDWSKWKLCCRTMVSSDMGMTFWRAKVTRSDFSTPLVNQILMLITIVGVFAVKYKRKCKTPTYLTMILTFLKAD